MAGVSNNADDVSTLYACVNTGNLDALRTQPVPFQRLVKLFDEALKVHPISFQVLLNFD